jgi:hypothetical protein
MSGHTLAAVVTTTSSAGSSNESSGYQSTCFDNEGPASCGPPRFKLPCRGGWARASAACIRAVATSGNRCSWYWQFASTKEKWTGAIMLLSAVACFVAGLVPWIPHADRGPSPLYHASSSGGSRREYYRQRWQFIQQVLSVDELDLDPLSPQYRVLTWLVRHDQQTPHPHQDASSAALDEAAWQERIRQRYAALVCSVVWGQGTINADEAVDDRDWSANGTSVWKPWWERVNDHECSFPGFTCGPLSLDELDWYSREISLDKDDQPHQHRRLAMTTTAPRQAVTAIQFSHQAFYSVLPRELGLLTHLQVLEMTQCQLFGTIPTQVYALTDLRKCPEMRA